LPLIFLPSTVPVYVTTKSVPCAEILYFQRQFIALYGAVTGSFTQLTFEFP